MPTPAWSNNNALANFLAQNPKLAPEVWKHIVRVNTKDTDWYSTLQGKTPRSVVLMEEDTSKGNGTTVNVTTRTGFYGRGFQGDAAIGDKTEKMRWGGYGVKVDFLRNAVTW